MERDKNDRALGILNVKLNKLSGKKYNALR